MTDAEFIRAFEDCTLPNEFFHHRDHLRLAWIYLRIYGERGARTRMSESIRRFAAFHGKSDKYHETMTLAWLRLVANAMAAVPHDASFDQMILRSPELLQKQTVEKYYSSAALSSGAARACWIEPDLQPLP